MNAEERDGAEIVASATECTGLVPALCGDGDEQAIRALYAVPRAKRPKGPAPAK